MHTTDESTPTTPTVRVVFDGPPFAGKTTAARALSEALGGTVVTPDEADGRTLWFDWMAYDAGHHAGQPIRVELVTVPGQQDLADRRRHLINWGDVIVFVANTSRAVFNDSVAAFRDLRQQLVERAGTPVVVIANKRDLIDAMPMDEVTNQLGLTASDILIEGIAINGGGIREAFVHAVHAALEDPARRLDATTADALLADLQAVVEQGATDHRAFPAPETTEPLADELVAEELVAEEPAVPEPVAEELVAEEPAVPAPVAEAPFATDLAPENPMLPAGLSIELHRPRLNPGAIAEGDAVVILAEHWRVLVDVAQGSTKIPRTDDPAEAVVVAELAAWGLLVDEPAPTLATAPTEQIEPVEQIAAADPELETETLVEMLPTTTALFVEPSTPFESIPSVETSHETESAPTASYPDPSYAAPIDTAPADAASTIRF